MNSHNIVDVVSGASLFLFTGGIISEVEIIQMISGFGVPAVLYFWLRDTKEQMKELNSTFLKEQQNIREDHHKHLEEVKTMFEKHSAKLESTIRDKEQIIKLLKEQYQE